MTLNKLVYIYKHEKYKVLKKTEQKKNQKLNTD